MTTGVSVTPAGSAGQRSSNLARTLAGRLIPALGILGLVVAATFFVLSVPRSYIGVDVVRNGDRWTAAQPEFFGLGRQSGVRSGDTVVAVNGVPAELWESTGGRIKASTIKELEVVNARGVARTVSLEGAGLPLNQVVEAVIYFLIGMSFWTISAFVYKKKPGSLVAALLYLLGTATLVSLTSVIAVGRGLPRALEVEMGSQMVIGSLFAHIFLLFPVDRVKNRSWILPALYVPPLAGLALTVVAIAGGGIDTRFLARVLLLPILSIGIITGLVSLVHSSFKGQYVRYRQQARIVMFGTIIGVLPFLIFSVFPYIAAQKLTVPPHLSIVALAALPASLGYALVRHQLLDVDLVIGRGVVYGLISLAVAVVYVAITWGVYSTVDPRAHITAVLLVVLLGTLALVSFSGVRGVVQEAIDRRFYRDRYDYRQVVSSLSTSLAAMSDLDEIAHFTTSSVTTVLALSGACLLLYTKQGYLYPKSATGQYLDAPEHARLSALASGLKEDDLFPNQAPGGQGVAFVVPIKVANRRTGMLCLGQKSSRQEYSVADLSFLFTFANQAGTAIENAQLSTEAREHRAELEKAYVQLQESSQELGKRKKELEDAYLGMARTLVLTLESRDPYTRGHSERVSRLAARTGRSMGVNSEEQQKLEMAARLHDIGKTGVADAVLLKPGPFEPSERAEIEQHPTRAVEILRFLDFLRDVLPVIESHHEWYNGLGYPRGLKGQDIPLGGRILAVADAYDAMVSKRPHRPALPHDEAIRRLREGAGIQWDPNVIQAFIRSEGK